MGVRGLRHTVRFAHTDDGHRLAVTEVDHAAAQPAEPGAIPVLLVHGFAQNRLAFALGPLPEALLALGLRVFIGELRGHGHSRDSLGATGRHDWGMAVHLQYDLPAIVQLVLQECGVSTLHFMGHSMGGLLGYAALASAPPFASLTGWAAPIWLGAGRPVVAVAARVVPPLVRLGRPARVPMNHLLGLLSSPLSDPEASWPVRALQRFVGLSNPHQASPHDLKAILGGADPESSEVFFELSQLSARRRPRVAGVDLIEAIQAWPGRLAAVVGAHDIFAGPQSVVPLQGPGHAGLRQIFCIAQGTHVDVAMGHHVPETIESLRPFLRLDSHAVREY